MWGMKTLPFNFPLEVVDLSWEPRGQDGSGAL